MHESQHHDLDFCFRVKAEANGGAELGRLGGFPAATPYPGERAGGCRLVPRFAGRIELRQREFEEA